MDGIPNDLYKNSCWNSIGFPLDSNGGYEALLDWFSEDCYKDSVMISTKVSTRIQKDSIDFL